MSETVDQLPGKASQVPFERLVESRSTTPVEAFTPEPASVPFETVRSTCVPYQVPLAGETDWPVGAAVSGVTVNVRVAVPPAPFVTVTVFVPLAVSLAPHEYELAY